MNTYEALIKEYFNMWVGGVALSRGGDEQITGY
jgi:hypothetical protein